MRTGAGAASCDHGEDERLRDIQPQGEGQRQGYSCTALVPGDADYILVNSGGPAGWTGGDGGREMKEHASTSFGL